MAGNGLEDFPQLLPGQRGIVLQQPLGVRQRLLQGARGSFAHAAASRGAPTGRAAGKGRDAGGKVQYMRQRSTRGVRSLPANPSAR